MSKDNMHVYPMTGQDTVIRHGDAPILHDPVKIDITGTLSAPGIYFNGRANEWELNNTHVVFNKNGSKSYIELHVEPKSVFGSKVRGELALNSDLQDFGINAQKTFTTTELASFLKLRRSLFADKDECFKVVSALKSFKARVESDITDERDTRGNKHIALQKAVETQLPKDFKLELPIFQGYEPVSFLVELCLDVTDGGTRVWLESADLAELIRENKDRIFESELKIFRDAQLVVMELF